MEPIIRKLPVPLTDEKKARLAEELALKEQELQEARETKKSSNSAINSRINLIYESVIEIAGKINTNSEKSEVLCAWKIDRELDRKELIRLDTNECVEWTGLTDEDRQVGLFEAPEVKAAEERDIQDDPADAFSPVPAVDPPAEDKTADEHGSFVNARYRGLRKKRAVN